MEIMDSDQMDRATAMWAVYAFVVANLDEMLPRLAEDEVAPTQAELDRIFGPVDLGAPSICEMYGSGSDCAISSGVGALGVILIGVMIGVAAGACAGRLCVGGNDKSGYKPVEMSPISRQSSE